MSKNLVEIEMKDGSKIALNLLTSADLGNVKLTEKDGETNLTMKTCLLKEDDEFEYERRLFKWTTMPVLSMYTFKRPKTLEAFKMLKTDKEILDYGVNNFAIDSDKANNGIEAKGTDPIKASNKLAQTLIAKGVPEAVAMDIVRKTEAAMKKAGFGK